MGAEISRFGTLWQYRSIFRQDHLLKSPSETIKRLLAFPPDTNIVWKSHDDSIAQRSAIDQARHEKGGPGNAQKQRRETINEDPALEKSRDSA